MFKFLGYFFDYIWDLIQAGLGNPIPLAQDYGVGTSSGDSNSPTGNTKDKANLTPSGEKIIGLRDPSLIKVPSTLTTTTFDTTTYGDRAVLKLTNSTGSSVDLVGLSVRGKLVLQLAGQNGYVWNYSDYDNIEQNGESFVEVSNDFIIDPIQAKQIGDFVWKELKPHKMYQCQLIGMHYEYEIGDVWHITLSYTLNSGTLENIDTDVEVMGVSMARDVGDVGTTIVTFRVPSESWALTLAKNTKLVGAGKAQWLNNRSNIVTVASSTWTGQADYYCDGVDDDVEIQAAIDYIYSKNGGIVHLTSGDFTLSATVTIKENITLEGETATYIKPKDSSVINIITANEICSIKNFHVDGSNIYFALSNSQIILGNTTQYIDAQNIIIQNYNVTLNYASSLNFYCFRGITTGINCKIHSCNFVVGSGYYGIVSMFSGKNSFSCCDAYSNTITATGAALGTLIGFDGGATVSNCSIYSNELIANSGSHYIYGFQSKTSPSSCLFYSNTSARYMRAFTQCSYLSSCVAYSNVSYDYVGYYQCNNISVCSSLSNSGSSSEVGFGGCKSVQQCKTDDTTKYASSYADSGTSNACADTAAGGYNS